MPHNKKIQHDSSGDFWITGGIFSNHYLLERLPQAGSAIWPPDEIISSKFKNIQELYKKNIYGLRRGNEADTERRFIDKIFDELGYGYLNRNKIPAALRRQMPDYFLYATQEDADKAFKLSPSEKYRLAISIAEAKRWDHNLEQPSSGKGKAPKGWYPHQQIRDYLNESEHIKWGILTNGKEWKLFFKGSRSSKFFEIDLEKCLEDPQRFKYFYVLFRPGSFIQDSSGRCLLDNILEESLRFQEDVEKDLREKVFKCVEWLGQGFLSKKENNLTKKDLDSIYHHSLILLYRILFVLNAEARNLLSTDARTNYYKHYGLQRIKEKLSQGRDEFIGTKTILYDELLELFHLINGENEKLNKDMNVPRYNGGLFDPERHKFLEEKKVGDDVVSKVIYELSFRIDKNTEVHSIDYKGLGERHLGTVYEGLLEHKFSFTNGEIVLKNDKGERKTTGVYYTPDYIVKYIVENTLGPTLNNIDERIRNESRGKLFKDDSFANAVLELNICDPAMGSGHFLVEAVQYLAEEIAYHPTTQLKTKKEMAEDEVNYWKRKVVESCIYGIDIKELAVELAKLSLWLKTVDKSQPLNFLDHHLRCGNSLIGARINDLNYLPLSKGKQRKSEEQSAQLAFFDVSQFKEDITAVIKGFHAIEEIPSEKLSDIKTKEMTFKKLTEELDRYREIADLWTSLFFGNNLEEKERVYEELLQEQYKFQKDLFGPDSALVEKKKSKIGISNQIYNFIVRALQSPDRKMPISALGSLLEKSESIAREKNFFHWELEFPEVFFNEDGGPKENPGFDCIIGNPPYVMELRENKEMFRELQNSPIGQKYYEAKMDVFYFFIEHGLDLIKKSSYLGFIIQEYWVSRAHASKLRKKIFDESIPKLLVDFKGFPVFKESTGQHNMIIILEKSKDKDKTLILTLKDSNAKENEIIKALVLDPKKRGLIFDATVRKASELYNTTTDKVYLVESEISDLQNKLVEMGFNLVDEEIQQGLVTPQDYLTPEALSKLPNPEDHKSGQGIFVLSKEEFEKIKWTKDELKILKPFHYADELDKYSFTTEAKYYLIYTPNKTAKDIAENPNKYSNIKGHLDKYQAIITSDNKPYGIHRARQPEWFEDALKIMSVRKTKYPKFVIVPEPYYMNQSVFIIRLVRHEDYSPFFINAILNSKIAHFWFYQQKRQGEQLQIDKEVILHFPIPHISFTTPKKERKEFYREAITLYRGSKYEEILKWAEYEIALKRNDTVHNFLAYLAEQMIEMNKDKNKEINGFLKWLERGIGCKLDNLVGKTVLKDYHEGNFTTLLDVLKKNNQRLSIEPTNRKTQETLEKHFEESMSLLIPLKDKIKATDNLIDQIVHKLYGLSATEIEIVEGRK